MRKAGRKLPIDALCRIEHVGDRMGPSESNDKFRHLGDRRPRLRPPSDRLHRFFNSRKEGDSESGPPLSVPSDGFTEFRYRSGPKRTRELTERARQRDPGERSASPHQRTGQPGPSWPSPQAHPPRECGLSRDHQPARDWKVAQLRCPLGPRAEGLEPREARHRRQRSPFQCNWPAVTITPRRSSARKGADRLRQYGMLSRGLHRIHGHRGRRPGRANCEWLSER